MKALFAQLVLAAAVLGTSCERIFEYEGDCDALYYVEFSYKMNMEFAEAFSQQVESVDLYVFDAKTGAFIKNYAEAGEALKNENYRMAVDLQPGTYEFVAWCGLKDGSLFDLKRTAAVNSDLTCKLQYKVEGGLPYSDEELGLLFHGKKIDTLPDAAGEHVVTIDLVRDTNNINLSFSQIGDAGMAEGQFSVSMVDDNGSMNYDNTLQPDLAIDYRPWTERYFTTEYNAAAAAAEEDAEEDAFNTYKAEISTARLMADHSPKIVITDNETGNVIYSIPIVEWAKEMRSERYASMDDQEYLDRQHDYDVMLYLKDDAKQGWIAVSIEINGWRKNDLGSPNI